MIFRIEDWIEFEYAYKVVRGRPIGIAGVTLIVACGLCYIGYLIKRYFGESFGSLDHDLDVMNSWLLWSWVLGGIGFVCLILTLNEVAQGR